MKDKDYISFDSDKQHDNAEQLKKQLKTDKIKKRMHIARISVFFSVFLAIAGGLIVFERPTVSEIENRNLTPMPEYSRNDLISGKYTDGITEYYNDTVPFRSLFKDVSATFKDMLGIKVEGIKIHSIKKPVDNNEGNEPEVTTVTTTLPPVTEPVVTDVTQSTDTTDTTTTPVTTPTPPPITEPEVPTPPEDNGMLSNNIMIYKNRGIPIYYGSMDAGSQYAAYVNNYKADLGDSVNVYSMVCPTVMSFYWPEGSRVSHGSEAENLENIRQHLVGVNDVNILPILDEHKNEHIYSRTDHHWQALGAYYACKTFTEVAGVNFAPLSSYARVVEKGYVGTLYGYSGDITLKNNPEEFAYYAPSNEYHTDYYSKNFDFLYSGSMLTEAYGSSLYCTFLGGDEYVAHIGTDQHNGRTLMIIKDSYGNALPPFLTNSFENIYVVDMRYFQRNAIQFARDQGVTDILFAMNTFSATGGNYKKLEKLRTQ